MNTIELLKLILPVLVAIAGSGGIVAYYTYKGNKPKTDAESQKIKVEAEISFAEGWKTLAEKMEDRVNKLEADIAKLRQSLDEQDEKYRQIIRKKDEEISNLTDRVKFLETELAKYTNASAKVDEVSDTLHKDVDANMDKLRKK